MLFRILNNHIVRNIMKKISLVFLIILLSCFGVMAEDHVSENNSGKPFVKIFTNFHSSFEDGISHQAFEIQRAYFGYSYKLDENWSAKVNLDFANPGSGSLKMTAYLKYAYFQYKKDLLTVKFGLIGLSHFSLQEKQWGNRYLYKSFQDQHKFGSSADLAIYASYKIDKTISIDATIANGEGYKNLESDSLFKYSIGLTFNIGNGFDVRTYYDFMGTENTQQTLSFYLGYTKGGFKGGLEFNQQLNNKMHRNRDLTGVSFYASYKFAKTRIYARYDHLNSNIIGSNSNPWHESKDGAAFIAGIEFNPVKGLKISPNFQTWTPKDNSPLEIIAYLSCEISF